VPFITRGDMVRMILAILAVTTVDEAVQAMLLAEAEIINVTTAIKAGSAAKGWLKKKRTGALAKVPPFLHRSGILSRDASQGERSPASFQLGTSSARGEDGSIDLLVTTRRNERVTISSSSLAKALDANRHGSLYIVNTEELGMSAERDAGRGLDALAKAHDSSRYDSVSHQGWRP